MNKQELWSWGKGRLNGKVSATTSLDKHTSVPSLVYTKTEKEGKGQEIERWKKLTKGIESPETLSHKHTPSVKEAGPESSLSFHNQVYSSVLTHTGQGSIKQDTHTWACTDMILLVRDHHFGHTSFQSSCFAASQHSWAHTVAAIWGPFPPPNWPSYSCLHFDGFHVCAVVPAWWSLPYGCSPALGLHSS